MKITYLYQHFVTPDMPGGSRGYEMARRLVASGHEVNLITSSRDQVHSRRGWEVTEIEGIKVHWLPVPYANSMTMTQRLRAFVRFSWAASFRAAALHADIIFATSTPLTIALPGAFAAWRRKCPMVFEVRDLWPEVPIAIGALRNPLLIRAARALESFAYRRTHRVIALSPGMAAGVVTTGFPEERVHVIPNGSDRARFRYDVRKAQRFRAQHPELGDGPIVLYAGTIGKVNGLEYLVKLASRYLAIDSRVRFVVLGDGAEAAEISLLAEQLKVAGRNFFQYARVSKERVVDAFCASSLVVSLVIDVPEMWNNSANKFFDGLAAGRPVAVNYEGWQADLIRNHDIGLVLDRDVEQAAERLVGFLSNNKQVDESGRAASQLALTMFDRDKLYDEFHTVLGCTVEEWRATHQR